VLLAETDVMTNALQAILASGPLAGVLLAALYVVWGKYQDALGKLEKCRTESSEKIQKLNDRHQGFMADLMKESTDGI